MRVLPGPQRKVRSWSGHSPPLSQTGQSSKRVVDEDELERRLLALGRARSEVWAVRTIIP